MKKNISGIACIALALISFFSVGVISAREAINVGAVLDDTVHMLEQVDPAMAAQMENITPEQQKELENQLNVVFDKMGTMSPEELKYLEEHPEEMFDFVEKTVGEQKAPASAEQTPISSAPSYEQKPEVKPTPAPTRPTAETIKTAELLEKIISITEEFMLKITTLKFEQKVDRWAEKNKIKNWQSGLTYKKFKEQLLTFVKKLRTITQEIDPETKQLAYIEPLTKNTALLGNLQKLYTTLSTQWQIVNVPTEEFDSLIHTVSRETKQALRTMLGAYAQALMSIPPQIDTLMKGYEPRTKELKEKEKQLSAAAEKEYKARQQRSGQPMRGLGAGERGYATKYPSSYSDYGGYGPYSPEYGSPYGYGAPGTTAEGEKGKTGGESGEGKGGKGGKEGEKEEKEKKEKESRPKEYLPESKKKSALENVKFHIRFFEEHLKETKEHITGGLPGKGVIKADLVGKATAAADMATDDIKKAEHEISVLDKKDQKKYTDEIVKLYETYREFFDGTVKNLTNIIAAEKKDAAEKAAQDDAKKSKKK